MTENNHSTVKTVSIHQSKIDVVKFDGTNNFDMWRCEVMDALNAQNLKDTLLCKRNQRRLQRKIEKR